MFRRNFKLWIWIAAPVALAAFLYLFNLARLPLEDTDEATYAMVVREMLRSGHYLTPTLHGRPWIDKPPLLFWLTSGSAKLFGLNEFALRLPEAIFGAAALAAYFASLIKKKGRFNNGGFFLFSTFALSASAFTFGIFLLPTTKLVTYFIPSYPFLAMFISSVYGRLLSATDKQALQNYDPRRGGARHSHGDNRRFKRSFF